MRTRYEIENAGTSHIEDTMTSLILEVLLDIRELLNPKQDE